MEKNIKLADIYIKIYNKQPLMFDDLMFLSAFDPECFEKTCKNLLYNLPEAKELMKPQNAEESRKAEVPAMREASQSAAAAEKLQEQTAVQAAMQKPQKEEITALLENLKRMEWKEDLVKEIDVECVKNLLGSLYMEMLFPHNDRYQYFQLEDHIESTVFNKRA